MSAAHLEAMVPLPLLCWPKVHARITSDFCVVQVNVTVAMGTERAGSPPPVVFHPCHLCGLTYTSAIMLSNHLASIHGGEKNVLCCKVQSVGMAGTYRDVLKHCVSF